MLATCETSVMTQGMWFRGLYWAFQNWVQRTWPSPYPIRNIAFVVTLYMDNIKHQIMLGGNRSNEPWYALRRRT